MSMQEVSNFNMQPVNLKEAMEYARLISDSDLCPKDFKGKPGNVLVAVQMGAELGLKPIQAIQNIAVINGRPCVWGDSMWALIKSHPELENITEAYNEKKAVCLIKRKNTDEHRVEFTIEEATEAGLMSKDPWKKYTKRMLMWRARTWCARDVFADALKGVQIAEEVNDYPEKNITPTKYNTKQKQASLLSDTEKQEKEQDNINSLNAHPIHDETVGQEVENAFN